MFAGELHASAASTALCNEANIQRDSDFSYILYGRSLYWNDSYKKNRATINVGLRYDQQFDIARAATHAGERHPAGSAARRLQFTGRRFGRALQQPVAARRLHLRPDAATARRVLKVNAGRYYGLGMYTASTLQPTTTRRRCATRWRDLNGDNSVQRNELDLAKGS